MHGSPAEKVQFSRVRRGGTGWCLEGGAINRNTIGQAKFELSVWYIRPVKKGAQFFSK
jgi:hypothetical protein